MGRGVVTVITDPSPPETVTEEMSSTVNALFAVGLELAAVRCLVDGEAGRRIERAIGALDDVIADVRSLLDTG